MESVVAIVGTNVEKRKKENVGRFGNGGMFVIAFKGTWN